MQCKTAFHGFTKKQGVFENLRQALCIAQPNTTNGLNDTGEDIAIPLFSRNVSSFLKLNSCLLFFIQPIVNTSCQQHAAPETKPNIILMNIDDMG